jgi:hypothetical protein
VAQAALARKEQLQAVLWHLGKVYAEVKDQEVELTHKRFNKKNMRGSKEGSREDLGLLDLQ